MVAAAAARVAAVVLRVLYLFRCMSVFGLVVVIASEGTAGGVLLGVALFRGVDVVSVALIFVGVWMTRDTSHLVDVEGFTCFATLDVGVVQGGAPVVEVVGVMVALSDRG